MENENKNTIPEDALTPENESAEDVKTVPAAEAEAPVAAAENSDAEVTVAEEPSAAPAEDAPVKDENDFQEALAALQAFSAKYAAPAEENTEKAPAPKKAAGRTHAPARSAGKTPAPVKAPGKAPAKAAGKAPRKKAPVTEAPHEPVTENTVSFTFPVTEPVDDLGATQKFTPVSEEDAAADMSKQNPPRRKAPIRKGRPAPKKGYGLLGIPHIISTAIWLAIILAIGISMGRMLWVCAADLLAFGKPDKVITVTIDEDDSIKDIAAKLEEAGLIRYPNLFVLFSDLTGKGDRIVPDTYNLNSMYDYNALLKMMSYKPANTEVVDIMIPEGYNCAQIFKLLDEKGVCSAEKLEEWAANGELKDYWFLDGLPRGTKYCLEGYLYPDTYKFYKDADPQYVLQKFLNNFDTRFTDKMYNDFIAMQNRFSKMLRNNGYSSSYANSHKLTFHQYITLASIVEEEKANSAEGYDIAAVFYNRLAKPGSYPRLDSDATVYYAIGSYFERKPLTQADLKNPSPYNTRKSNGLPPGPISNPGSYSLYAALYPSETKYYYFIFDKTAGVHRFSKTLAEHNKWASQLG